MTLIDPARASCKTPYLERLFNIPVYPRVSVRINRVHLCVFAGVSQLTQKIVLAPTIWPNIVGGESDKNFGKTSKYNNYGPFPLYEGQQVRFKS